MVYYDPSGHNQAVNPSNGSEITNTANVGNSNSGASHANEGMPTYELSPNIDIEK